MMNKIFLFLTFLFPGGLLFSQSLEVIRTTCEYRDNPLGIEVSSPALGWQLGSDKRGVVQTAYRILVSDQPGLLNKQVGNIWDSKIVYSSASLQVPYKGKKLLPAKTYYWKVQVWDQNKKASAWSETAFWQMGLLSQIDWKGARWIGLEAMPDSVKMVPAQHQRGDPKWWNVKDVLPLLRKKITVTKTVKKATAYICGLGHFEISLNGEKIGDHFLDPGWTQYDKEAQYVVFDVTKQIRNGENALGVMLGNGFYFIPRQRYRKLTGAFGFPKMILRLHLEYADGSNADIVSDAGWKADAGPITFSSIYGGEDYNANIEQTGWDRPGFDDRSWKKVVLVSGPPKLYAQSAEPLKVHEQFDPINSVKLRDSVYVFDLGQNASGIPQINVVGKKGSTVRIIPAELLKEDGSANQRATGSPVYFEYVLKGGETETWQPRFSYYGFRYLQVEGVALEGDNNLADLPLLLGVRGLHTRNSAEQVGFFHCSSELFNKTHALIDWSIKSNLASVMTDCPHREKLGWLEQVHLMGNSIRFNYDMANFFRKTIRDMKTAQGNGKLVPEYVPEYVKMPFMDGIFMDSPEWGSTSIILPWYLYQWYGDRRTLEESYPMMQKYLEHLKEKSKDHIVAYGLSDWYDLGPERPGLAQLTPMGVTGTAIYYYDLGIMSKTAKLLGKTADARKYDELAIEVRKAFNHKFFDPQTKQYATGSQTANAIAVYTGLVEPQNRQAVIENIIKDLRSRNNALTAGDIGYRYLLRVLEEAGRSDVIFDMNSRSDVPGYGYQLKKGATALTESWMASPLVSNNHLMLGHLMEWFYTGLAGLGQEEGSTAFKNMVIRPQPVGDLTGLSVMFNAPYGWVNTKWERTDQRFELNITIPANTTATVRIPAANANWISEGKKKLKEHSELKMVRTGEGWVDVKIGSGNYHFIVEELKSN